MTANDKYSRSNRENFSQPTQILLCKELKAFCQIFIAALKFRQNFEHFEKKDENHSLSISEIIDSER